MSSPQQQPPINPNSLKIRLAFRFLQALNTLHKSPASKNTQIHRRSHRVKIAAYASMASVTGSRRAWSRTILWKIRNPSQRSKKMGRVRRNINPRRDGDSGLEVKLRKLIPGGATMDACGLLDETADYIKCLATQVEVMKTLVDLYSTI